MLSEDGMEGRQGPESAVHRLSLQLRIVRY